MIYQLYKKQVEAWKEEITLLFATVCHENKDDIGGMKLCEGCKRHRDRYVNIRHKDTIELLEAEIERKRGVKQEHGAYWDSNEKGLRCNSEHELCEIRAYNQCLDEDIAYLEETVQKIKKEI